MIGILRNTCIALAAAILLGIGGALACVHPRFFFGTLVGDDAGYYLAIARNVCLGHGFSFDRLNSTNGFNPLMPMLLIPIDRLLAPGYDLVACFRVGALVTWSALLLGLWPLDRLTDRVLEGEGMAAGARSLARAAMAFFYAGFVALKGYYGMDAFLVLPLGLFYLDHVAARGLLAPGAGAAVVSGALLSATVLARVDSLPFALAAFACMLPLLRSGPQALAAFAGRFAVFGAVLAPYLAWNRLSSGDWLPISARLKSAFPHVDLARSLHTVLHSSLNPVDRVLVFVALALALAWLVAVLARPPRRAAAATGASDALTVCALYVAARLAWLLAFSRLDVQGSYFLLAHPFVALVLLVAARRIGGAPAAAPAGAALALASAVLALAKLHTMVPDFRAIASGRGDEWAIARRVHDAVSDRDVLYGGAFGLIGFAADRPWINGDGVANNRAYQEAIRGGRLSRLLAGEGVTHVVVTVAPPRAPGPGPIVLEVPSPLYGARDSVLARPGDLVLREPLRRGGGSELWLVRWRGAPGS